MTEGSPKSPEEPIEPEKEPQAEIGSTTPETQPVRSEREPVSYEQALDAARKLRAIGVENPFDTDRYGENSPEQQAQNTIEAWAEGSHLAMGGEYTPEKATDMARYLTLWITAGYNDLEMLRSARERLKDERDLAGKEDKEEAVEILDRALQMIQIKTELTDPKEQLRLAVEASFKKAEAEIAEGRKVRAISTIYQTLTAKLWPEAITDDQRAHYIELMNQLSRETNSPVDETFTGFPKNYKKRKK